MKISCLVLSVMLFLPLALSAQQDSECIDTDGDGWGWNETLKQSCIPSGASNPPTKDPVGVKVSWPANPAEEMIEGYVVKLLVNNVVAAQENTDGTSLSFQFDVIQATFLDEICVQIAAFRKDETSPYSGKNCIVVPEKLLPSMSIPGLPAMVWFYEG